MLPCEDAVDVAVEEPLAAKRVAVGIEVRRNRARSHRPAGQANIGEFVDQPNDGRLGFHDEELPAALTPVSHDHAGFITKGNGAAIPIAGGSVAAAVASGEDRGVVGVFFVYQTDHTPHETTIGVVRDVLDHRHQSDTCFIELVFRRHLGEQPPRKSGEHVNDDDLHGPVCRCRLGNHPVEFAPLQLATGDIKLLEFLDDFDTLLLAPCATGRTLGHAGCIVAVLIVVRNTGVDVGTKRLGHTCVSRSVGSIVEQRREPAAQILIYERRLARQEYIEPLGDVGADALRIRIDRT
ncbi:hypothetical protein ASG11_16005 [Sphingomonas sp. Leaf357]|nr:hypothetical protein ASG11_16005 [Sphingomonas sp. Leaf357]